MGKRWCQLAYNLVKRGNRKRLRRLLGKHEELRTSNHSTLVFAAIWHNRAMLRWLLERGVSPDCRHMGDRGNTPLMQAAADGDVVVMKSLLEFGADPNALNGHSENPLGFACTYEQTESIRLLAAAGVDLNNMDDSGPGRTQLDWAEMSGWHEVVDVLRALGGRTFAEMHGERTI